MKKYFVIAILAVIATSSYYCTKKSNEPLVADHEEHLEIDKAATGSGCTCPAGYASCSADCWFSDCCICWDPKRETGGCGCWLGVSSCKTAPIGSTSGASTAVKTIRFYPDRFSSYLNYLKQFGVSTTALSNSITTMSAAGQSGVNSKGNFVLVKPGDYDQFFAAYESYINTLSREQQSAVSNYIATLK